MSRRAVPLGVVLVLAEAAGCGGPSAPTLSYRVARTSLDLGTTAWNASTLPVDTLSVLNLSEQSLLVTPLGLEGDGSDAIRWIEFPDYTEVRPGESVSLSITLVEDRSPWDDGATEVTLSVEVGAAWNDPSDFDVAPVWYEDTLTVPVTATLDCDVDADGIEAWACGGADCDDAAPEVPPDPACTAAPPAPTGGTTGDTGVADSEAPTGDVPDPEDPEDPPLEDTGFGDGTDDDGDGWFTSRDCDDADPAVHPHAPDACDDVDADCSGSDDGLATVEGGGTYTSLQAAVDAAPAGATITVCPGTWAESVVVARSVALVGRDGADLTVVDATGLGAPAVTVTGGDFSASGLGFVGGSGEDRAGTTWGGGVSALDADSLTLVDCRVDANTADIGAGVAGPLAGVAWIERTSLADNAAVDRGGALWLTEGTLTGATFTNNTALEGGAIAVDDGGDATLDGVELVTNTAAERGGGAVVGLGAVLVDRAGRWVGNASDRYGGAIYADRDAVVALDGTTLDNNRAVDQGGGIYAVHAAVTSAGGTFVGADGGRFGGVAFLFDGATLDVTDAVLSYNTADQGAVVYVNLGSAATLTRSSLEGNVSAGGGGAFLSADATLVSTASDWGTGLAANVPDDVDFAPPGGAVASLGAAATVVCETGSNTCL